MVEAICFSSKDRNMKEINEKRQKRGEYILKQIELPNNQICTDVEDSCFHMNSMCKFITLCQRHLKFIFMHKQKMILLKLHEFTLLKFNTLKVQDPILNRKRRYLLSNGFIEPQVSSSSVYRVFIHVCSTQCSPLPSLLLGSIRRVFPVL